MIIRGAHISRGVGDRKAIIKAAVYQKGAKVQDERDARANIFCEGKSEAVAQLRTSLGTGLSTTPFIRNHLSLPAL